MNAELLSQVEHVAQAAVASRTGDIASLAAVLDSLQGLSDLAGEQGVGDLLPPANALCDQLRRLIMGDVEDDEAALALLREAVGLIQDELADGRVPPLERYPAALKLGLDDGNGAGAEAEGAFAADRELLAEYLSEQRGRLDEIEGHLLALERGEATHALDDLRRALHTIKGDSGFLGLSHVAQICHAAETYLETLEPPYDVDALLTVKDWLGHAFEDLTTTDGLSRDTVGRLGGVLGMLQASPEVAAAVADDAPPVAVASQPAVSVEPPPASEPPPAFEPPPAPEPTAPEETPLASEPATIDETVAAAAEAGEPAAAAEAPPGAEPTAVQLTAEESLLVDFISESKEHLDMASSELLALESNPESEDALNSVFRAFHTIKGIAGFLNLGEIQQLSHDTETLLDQTRRAELELTPGLIDLVFEALDWLQRLIANVGEALNADGMVRSEPQVADLLRRIEAARAGKVPERPASPVSPQAPAQAAPATVAQPAAGAPRPAEAGRLGQLLVEAGQLTQADLDRTLEEVEGTDRKLGEVLVEKRLVTPSDVHNALRRQQEARGGRKTVELKETIRVDYERLEGLIDTVGELVLAEAMISQDEDLQEVKSEALSRKLYNLRQVSRKLQEMGTTIRMVPISGTFQKMARLVRDLSRKSGKPISFHTRGDETELDRAYVDQIADPLVHMIRNAVDHGIEPAQERTAAGKDESGTIWLRAYHEGGNIHVVVEDDGRGLSAEKIRAKAIERGLVEPDAELSEEETHQLIFEPGFSTAAQVTEVSGRGVGMDVVRRNIAELRGQVHITSRPGEGTVFTITLPLTLALIDGMLVRVGQERFIFPVLSVVESARPSADMVNTIVGRGEMISLRNRQIPLYRLARLFDLPGAKQDVEEALVVVVEHNGKLVGIMVDDLIGMQQTVIKSLSGGLFKSTGFSGSTILPDGRVGLIVDIAGMIELAQSGGAPRTLQA